VVLGVRVRGAMIHAVSVRVVRGGSLVLAVVPGVRVRGAMIHAVSVRVVRGGSLVLAVVPGVRVRGAMNRAVSVDRTVAANRKADHGAPARAAVVAERTIAAVVAPAIVRRPVANLEAAADPGTAMARRVRAQLQAIALVATEVGRRPAGVIARAGRHDRVTARATNLVLRRAARHERRRRMIAAVMLVVAALVAIVRTRIGPRCGARQVGPSADLPANPAGSREAPVWSFQQIWTCNNSRAACAPSCAV
jgi:hypothetical protein